MSFEASNEFYWRQVEDCYAPDYELFKSNYLSKRIPVVIKNSASQWKAFDKWTPDYLKRRLGSKLVLPDAGYWAVAEKDGKEYPFDELINLIEHSTEEEPAPYLRNFDIHSLLPELSEDIQPRLIYALPNWLTCRLIPKVVTDGLVELFIGGKSVGFPNLHFDTHGSNAFITQIFGRKEVILFSPAQTKTLCELFGTPEEFELAKLEALSVASEPALATLKGYRILLRPGDTAFVPAGWWHTTMMNELSITISTNNVNQANWHAYVDSMTDYNRGVKKFLKTKYLIAVGSLLRILEKFGQSKILLRPVDGA